MKTKEELLRKRYRVIANYPNGRYRKGEIVYPNKVGFLSWAGNPNDYPDIFEEMEWFEEMAEEDLPQYLKNANGVYKVKGYHLQAGEFAVLDGNYTGNTALMHFKPATLKEYNEYIKTKP